MKKYTDYIYWFDVNCYKWGNKSVCEWLTKTIILFCMQSAVRTTHDINFCDEKEYEIV